MTTPASEKNMILIYEPHAEESSVQEKLAARFVNLDGKVIGLLDNTKDFARELLDEAKNTLLAKFPNAQFRYFRKKNVSGMPPELMAQVAGCDAVITAVGD